MMGVVKGCGDAASQETRAYVEVKEDAFGADKSTPPSEKPSSSTDTGDAAAAATAAAATREVGGRVVLVLD